MSVLKELQPASVFRFFEEICGIPHTSFHEKELSDYCVRFAEERGLFCTQDSVGNVIIVAEATKGYEKVEPIILQGHLDMVGAKEPQCDIDLEKDALRLVVNGDDLTAEGTTLGADNGIAVAYALAVLDAKDLPHPRLEVVLTVCEEVGLLGASQIDLSICQGRRMLNMDSEAEGVLTAGCAGGKRAKCSVLLKRETDSGMRCEVKISGLLGGHSGLEIDKGRANANVLLGRLLLFLDERVSCRLISVSGGSKENVIPNEGTAVLLVKPDQICDLEAALDRFHNQLVLEYAGSDPHIAIHLEKKEIQTVEVLDQTSMDKVMTALNYMPNGIQAMSADLPGLVETSLNLGVTETTGEELILRFSIRSSVPSVKEYLGEKIQYLTEKLGGHVSFQGDYPAWPYARQSAFRDQCIAIFREQYKREPEIQVIHAGLECGIFSDKIEGLDCISIGPDLYDVHTPKERVSVSSVARVWEYIKAVLATKKMDSH